jgi:hypothetical protein
MTAGNAALGDGDYVGALEKFRAAYNLFPSPKILLNIGTTLRALGRNVESMTVYEAYLKDPATDPARAAEVHRILDEVDAVIGRVRVEVNRPDAIVRVDGAEVAAFSNGKVVRVDAGQHTIVAESPGLPPAVETIVVGKREERVVSLRILRPGERTVVVERVVEKPQRLPGIVLMGVGLAGVAAGAIAGSVALVENKAASGHCFSSGGKCDASGISLDRTARGAALASTIAFAAGGGTFATGLILFLTARGAKPATSAPRAAPRLALAAGPLSASLRVEGAW